MCGKCNGWVIQRKGFTHEGSFFEKYCINCGWRAASADLKRIVYPRNRTRASLILVKTNRTDHHMGLV